MYHPMCKKLSWVVLMALVGLLTACKTAPEVRYVREPPPVELLSDCPEVIEQIKTNGQLALTILAYRDSVAKCNIDKQSLREWAKE